VDEQAPVRADSAVNERGAVYERGFRSLLWRLRPDGLHVAVDLLLRRAERASACCGSASAALETVYERARRQVIRQLLAARLGPRPDEPNAAETISRRRRARQIAELFALAVPPQPPADSPDFHCDSALGGLARWLRGAGYDAVWWPGIDDARLVRTVVGSSAILLTTDRPLMKHGTIAHGAVAALLIPVSLALDGQFAWCAKKLDLALKLPRCMACGGELDAVEKATVRQRIPPRTYPWLDKYLLCRRCGKLYWEGTHWQRIRRELERGSRSDSQAGQPTAWGGTPT